MKTPIDLSLVASTPGCRVAWLRFGFLAVLLALFVVLPLARGAVLQVDFVRTNGVFRALHGVNKGPLGAGGLMDLTEQHRALGIPFTRLHDCHWPNPDVVDIHVLFPDFNADPEKPESYDFTLTDEYLAAIRATGAQIVFRLGESIEHTKTKRFVHPPKDFEKWTAICLGIIRHYNEGWANGFHHGIRYWEIWNEPENRPVMWTGTDEEFLRLYSTAARGIKSRHPDLKVGGPAFGHSGQLVKGTFKPSEFVLKFLERCRRDGAPLDFMSWHCYTDNSAELMVRAKAIRALLDAQGFPKAESHLNEWNYLPGNSWNGLSKSGTGEVRQKFYDEMGGAPGAAFIVAALLELQDAPVEVCNFFHGETGGFGLFNENGVPLKSYHAMRAFRELLDTPQRVEARGSVAGEFAISAGVASSRRSATIVLSNTRHEDAQQRVELRHLPWRNATVHEVRILDGERNLNVVERGTNVAIGAIDLRLKPSSVAVITLQSMTDGK